MRISYPYDRVDDSQGPRWLKAESLVEARVSKQSDQREGANFSEAHDLVHQRTANSDSLVRRQDRQRRNCYHRSSFEIPPRPEYVPNDLGTFDGDQFQPNGRRLRLPRRQNDLDLLASIVVRTGECGKNDVQDCVTVVRQRGSNHQITRQQGHFPSVGHGPWRSTPNHEGGGRHPQQSRHDVRVCLVIKHASEASACDPSGTRRRNRSARRPARRSPSIDFSLGGRLVLAGFLPECGVNLVSEVVRNQAVAFNATRWLDELPTLITSLERDWLITVGRPFDDATEAFVAEATFEDGTLAVLKLIIPRDSDTSKNEITVLSLTEGDGCVRMLRSDVDRDAVLLERLGPSLKDLDLPTQERHEIMCATSARVWRRAPTCGLPTGAAKGRWLADSIAATWEELDHPCSERAVEYALTCATRRIEAHDDERAVLVHGDVHQWNTLKANDGFKLVDPDGLLAEAEYDMGIIMREDPIELLHGDPRQRARWLAARTGLDADAIWEWGVVERLSTGLLNTQIDFQPVGHQMLAVADAAAVGEP